MSRAILDTSVLIAREQARPVNRPLPDDVAVSVVSIAELEVGVLMARDAGTRGRRLRTLTEVRSLSGALPIDERTASAYARLAANVLGELVPVHSGIMREKGRRGKLEVLRVREN